MVFTSFHKEWSNWNVPTTLVNSEGSKSNKEKRKGHMAIEEEKKGGRKKRMQWKMEEKKARRESGGGRGEDEEAYPRSKVNG